MSFRRRPTIATAGAVAIVVLVTAVGAYLIVRGQLRAEVDEEPRERAAAVARFAPSLPDELPFRLPAPPPGARLGGAVGYVQPRRARW